MYNPKSKIADDFINHDEILETLKYADENKNNIELINKILDKAEPYSNEKGVFSPSISYTSSFE